MLQRILIVCLGLLVLACLKLLGEALSRWLQVEVPGSFWGFLVLFFVLGLVRRIPKSLVESSSFLMSHLTLFLLPSLVAATAAFGRVSHASSLLLLSGVVVTVLMAVVCGLVVMSWQRKRGER